MTRLRNKTFQERFQMSGETLPGTEDPHSSNSDNNKLRTFMNLKERKFLTDPNFELVSEEKEADVVFKEEKCSDFRCGIILLRLHVKCVFIFFAKC